MTATVIPSLPHPHAFSSARRRILARYSATALAALMCFALGLGATPFATAQAAEPATSPHFTDNEPKGRAVYLRYCAVCHGVDGRGAGPLSSALQKVPPDLSRLAENNGGTFPATRVATTIRDGAIPGHGRRTMLEWGKIFGSDTDPLEATATILDLTIFLESLQQR